MIMMRCSEGLRLGSSAGEKLLTFIVFLFSICLLIPLAEATGHILWQENMGGSQSDIAYSIAKTNQGYVVAGSTITLWRDDWDVTGNHGYLDWWIMNLGPSGDLIWKKCFGGIWDETAYSVQPTGDGKSYIVAGSACSKDGDVHGIHYNKDCKDECNPCPKDFWLVRLDPSGEIEWQKCLGGTKDDIAYSINQTSDGYIVAGSTQSNDGDAAGNHGGKDFWVVKLKEIILSPVAPDKPRPPAARDRPIQLDGPAMAGSGYEELGDGQNGTAEDAILSNLGAQNVSLTGSCCGSTGAREGTAAALQSAGGFMIVTEWQKCLGGSKDDEARSVRQTADGGYIVAGSTMSNDGNVSGNHGGKDFWMVKLNEVNNTLIAPDELCADSTGNVASVPEPGAEYLWFIENGQITSSNKTQSIIFSAEGHNLISE
jgi:hypothetical protein